MIAKSAFPKIELGALTVSFREIRRRFWAGFGAGFVTICTHWQQHF
jgi:hypothetical protein